MQVLILEKSNSELIDYSFAKEYSVKSCLLFSLNLYIAQIGIQDKILRHGHVRIQLHSIKSVFTGYLLDVPH